MGRHDVPIGRADGAIGYRLSVIGDEAIRQGNNNREVRASRLLYGV